MIELIVSFAGHSEEWRCISIKEKLFDCIENLIKKGYCIFYVGNNGVFDEICSQIVIDLKLKYSNVKLYRILTYYEPNNKKSHLPDFYDGTIYPDLENVFYKRKIVERNKWMVNNCNILVCFIQNSYKSGAFKTVEYARKINKPIIYI